MRNGSTIQSKNKNKIRKKYWQNTLSLNQTYDPGLSGVKCEEVILMRAVTVDL